MSFIDAWNSLFAHAAPAPVPPAPVKPPAIDLRPALAVVAPRLGAADIEGWVAALMDPMAKAGITTPRRVAAFLGQCSVESAGFTVLSENLNYSAAALCETWPTRFTSITAALPYNRDPQKIACCVYAGRLGNGDQASGDGWLYRGRGLIDVTGKANYQALATACKMTLADVVPFMETKAGAAASACWFWDSRNLGPLADAWQLTSISRLVNGGTEGLADRIALSNKALSALGNG